LAALYLGDQKHLPDPSAFGLADDGTHSAEGQVLDRVESQLGEYFAGTRTRFDLPLAPHGTAFQLEVWLALRSITFGATTSYGSIAAAVGRPSGARAVGAAVGRNPIGIIVPCHRVVGASGSLTGYAGGIERKSWLLTHERAI
jgi:methylated-DNA-[protein]-cysteine S-methyltransferase